MNAEKCAPIASVESLDAIPSPGAIEIAGALQATLLTMKERDFNLDIQQDQALQAIGKALVTGKSSGYVEMATGSGKTIIESLVTEAGVKAGKRVLIVAPTISITHQLYGHNQDRPTGLTRFTQLHNTASIAHKIARAKASQLDDVVVTTYQSFLAESQRSDNQWGNFDLIIADECHRSLGEKTAHAMRTAYPDAIRIGFSATPDYAIDRTSDEVFQERLFKFSLRDAIESGVTAPIRALVYQTDQTLELNDPQKEFTNAELAPLIDNPERNGTAFQLATAFVRDGRQGIIACIPGNTNIHARVMAAMLTQNGVHASDIGSHLTPAEVSQRLADFQSGALDVLTFTRALEEGWDSDKANFAINMAPTASPVRTTQLLGRILRPNLNGRESIYIDFLDNKQGNEKVQYTALHALDIETIDVNRVLGRHGGTSSWKNETYDLELLDHDLMKRILRSNGKLLTEVSLTRKAQSETDLLMAHWERILQKEDLSAELPQNDVWGNRFDKVYKQTQTRMTALNDGISPTHAEIVMELTETHAIPLFATDALKRYGVKMSLKEMSSLESMNIHKTPEEHAQRAAHLEELQAFLNSESFTSREREILKARFGLNQTDGPKRLDDIADQIGVSSVRVRQIETKAMAKLRMHRWAYASDDDSPLFNETMTKEQTQLKPSVHFEKHLENYIAKIVMYRDVLKIAEDQKYFFDFMRAVELYRDAFVIPTAAFGVPPDEFRNGLRQRGALLKERIDYYNGRVASLNTLPAANQETRKKTIDYLQFKIDDLQLSIHVMERLADSYSRTYPKMRHEYYD